MALVEQLKRHVAERSFQRSLNNETLDYKSIQIYMRMKWCRLSFFGSSKESMIRVENFEIEKWYDGGDTVPVTQSSHHLVPMSSSRIGPKLTSQDASGFCKSASHIPVNMPHPKHPTSPTSHIPNIQHLQHSTFATSQILNIPHCQHLTSWVSHIPNIPHHQHPTSQHHTTFHIPNITNIPYKLNFVITFNKILNTCEWIFKHSFNNIQI